MGKNMLFHDNGAPAGKALGDMLKANSTLKELDVSSGAHYASSKGGPSFAKGLADGLSANRALAKFTFSGRVTSWNGPRVTIETSMIEADFNGKKLGVSGAIILAAFLPKCQ